jgi:hypothetical protein
MKPILILLALAAILAAQPPDPAQVALRAAIDREVADGDLNAAIALYTSVVDTYKSNHAVAAQALFRLGQCHEKLGHAAASAAYHRVLSQYPSQKEAAAARARLAVLNSPGTPRTAQATLIWDNSTEDWASVSADGRYLSFVDWPTRSIGIRDLASSTNRVISNTTLFGRGRGEPGRNVISPDGKSVAFAYGTNASSSRGYTRLYVVNADGSNLNLLFTAAEHIEPLSWTPDSSRILASEWSGGSSRLILLPSAGGPPASCEIPARDRFGAAYASPDGRWFAYSAADSPGAAMTLYVSNKSTETKLAESANLMGWTPAGDAILFTRERAGKHHLYYLPLHNGHATGDPQLVPTTSDVGRTPMGITADGRLFFGSGNRQSDALFFPWSGDPARLGSPAHNFPVINSVPWLLGGGAVRFSPDGKLAVAPGPAGEILIKNFDTGALQTHLPQLRSLLRLEWAPRRNAVLLLGTNLADQFGVHRLDLTTGALDLVAVLPPASQFLPSPDGRTIYYGGASAVFARDLDSGKDTKLWEGAPAAGGQFQLHITRDAKTLVIRLSGSLHAIDLASRQIREIYSTGQADRLTLWASSLTPDDEAIMTVRRLPGMKMEFATFPLRGGEPQVSPAPSNFRGLALSPDAKWLATTRLTRRDQIWALSNFLPAKH